MGIFGKQSEDERKLRKRNPEVQEEIDQYYRLLRGELPGDSDFYPGFKAFMSMTIAEKADFERLKDLIDYSHLDSDERDGTSKA
jgi:hypothetical protein